MRCPVGETPSRSVWSRRPQAYVGRLPLYLGRPPTPDVCCLQPSALSGVSEASILLAVPENSDTMTTGTILVTNRHNTRPVWKFPPRSGGIDFVTDPSSAHFSDAPIPKLVREIVQNSLDAKDSGYVDPVVVEFTETSVSRGQIGGDSLEQHIAACFDRSAEDGRAGAMAMYKRALETSRGRTIRCLTVQDSGTVGLDDARWNALVAQEGAVSKLGGSPGGSYGIGKNAALNVSDLQTVFYSTRYVSRKGRVEKMQGKATLMGHMAPDGSGEQLQHIGFYAKPGGSLSWGGTFRPSSD